MQKLVKFITLSTCVLLAACAPQADEQPITQVNLHSEYLNNSDLEKINQGIKYCEPHINKMNTVLFPFLTGFEKNDNARSAYIFFDSPLKNAQRPLKSFLTKLEYYKKIYGENYKATDVHFAVDGTKMDWAKEIDWKYALIEDPEFDYKRVYIITDIPYECVEYVQNNAKLNGYDSVVKEVEGDDGSGVKIHTPLFIAKEINEY